MKRSVKAVAGPEASATGDLVRALAEYELAHAPTYGVRDLETAKRLVALRLRDPATFVVTPLAGTSPREAREMSAVVLRQLAFDSEIYEVSMAEMVYYVGAAPDILPKALAAARRRGISHIHYRPPVQDYLHIQRAEEHGFRFMSAFTGLVCHLRTYASGGDPRAEAPLRGQGITIRAAAGRDLPALEALAAEAFASGTRFHADPTLPAERTTALHKRWIANSLAGVVADAVLVADAAGAVAGVVTGRHEKALSAVLGQSLGSIGLFAVSDAWQGRGIGRALLEAVIRWFRERGAEWVEVGTESTNLAALTAYLSGGFRIARSACSLHVSLPEA